MLVIFSLKNIERGQEFKLTYLYACWIWDTIRDTISKYQNGMPKVARKAFNIGEVWNPVCCLSKLLSLYGGAHLVESYCKESHISDTNWLRYLSLSYLIKIWLSVWHHHLANLHILKTWISQEWKETFENSKQHFSSHKDYLFMFWNGLHRRDAIFIIVPF